MADPVEADAPQVALIKKVCDEKNAMLSRANGGQSERLLVAWQVPLTRLAEAVGEHIGNGYRIFKKNGANGRVIADKFHANVELAEGHDVYVEICLRDEMVILTAHGHYTGTVLPK